MLAATLKTAIPDFIEIRVTSVIPDEPLAFDLYLVVNGSPVLFRKRLDTLSQERIRHLVEKGGKTFLVPRDQRETYLASLYSVIRNSNATLEVKGQFIKESAFVHLNTLFTTDDVAPAVVDATKSVEEMVGLVMTDPKALTSLLSLSTHDYPTYRHSMNVAVYSIALAKKVLGEEKHLLLAAGQAGLLHDLGMRKLSPEILQKRLVSLSPIEMDAYRGHVVHAQHCLKDIPEVPPEVSLAIFQHHENFDGSGYPVGLQGQEISKLARLVAIADVFDELITEQGLTPKEALATMLKMQPGKFDPLFFGTFDKNFASKKST